MGLVAPQDSPVGPGVSPGRTGLFRIPEPVKVSAACGAGDVPPALLGREGSGPAGRPGRLPRWPVSLSPCCPLCGEVLPRSERRPPEIASPSTLLSKARFTTFIFYFYCIYFFFW